MSAGNCHNVFADVLGGRKLGLHIYLTAEESYHGFMKGTKQNIVSCGESGAGKTFTVRQMRKYLDIVARSFRQHASLLLVVFGSAFACWMRFQRCMECLDQFCRLHQHSFACEQIFPLFVLDAPSESFDFSRTFHFHRFIINDWFLVFA